MDTVNWKTIAGYATPVGLASTAGFVNEPTASLSSSTTRTRSIPQTTVIPTTLKTATSTTPVSVTSTRLNAPSAFAQMVRASYPILYGVPKEQLLSTSFDDMCPLGNCISDCSNISRVFQAVPDGIIADPQQYGRLDSNMKSEVTLFSMCSNLDYASNLAEVEKSSSFATHFSVNHSGELSTIASRMTTCFATTCEQTRNPALCATACSASNLLSSPTTFDYNKGLPDCVIRLCDSTCSLPYVDPDVLGIGVLVSYFIQATLLIICAAAFLASAGVQLWKEPETELKVRDALKSPLETFLRVQTLFGISLAIATFIMKPAEIDPLNGYALILTAVMGFLPPVFTLMLLHSHGVRSQFSTALVFVSYLVNTVTFYLLVRNLSTRPYDRVFLDEAINNLFSTEACGGNSAISLCYQLTGSDPVGFLAGFYNAKSFANIKTVPALWVWSTIVLLLLITRQVTASTEGSKPISELPSAKPKGRRNRQGLSGSFKILKNPVFTFSTLLLATIVFCLCLGYQYLMVQANTLMDVVDRDGWSFGQVVALLFWAPPLLDIVRSKYERKKYEKVEQA
ncbi:hypothetical protein CI238_01330 [Colletotrichum incanum]|uniref:Uncharacterized protein n=1 Tax=Colletotrichum incanum TaxID=1573173 RepID=A0A166ZVN3_COLIC|nr:hypothetical protein CI238_01330 [Colletotrichum incanum]